ncbi:MAG: hypothetical protein KC657_03335 [Myxococcales bacterium]|nr:hypothetical protein [Myxococcales bacterium]
MPSNLRSLPRAATVLMGAALAGVIAAGCMSSSESAFLAEGNRGLDDGVNDPAPSLAAADAGPGKQTTYRGSPLCKVIEGTCMPDGDERSTGILCADPDAGAAAADAASDGGAAGDPYAPQGCRVSEGASGSLTPQCGDTGAGDDGASCKSGAECKPGFECVEGERGAQCRRYCCLGTCKGQASSNGGSTFCDVRQATAGGHKVPVCMPLKACKLLTEGECGPEETCAVVTDEGATGCVPAGAGQVGETCDEEHCAKGLTCVGSPGARRCLQLCRVDKPCTGTQSCQSASFINDPKFGVCTP